MTYRTNLEQLLTAANQKAADYLEDSAGSKGSSNRLLAWDTAEEAYCDFLYQMKAEAKHPDDECPYNV